MLFLGATTLTNTNLSDYSGQLAAVGAALADTGDILLYGCEVAQGEVGLAFLNNLSRYTGADVAASTNVTGFGGDWLLETTVGSMEAENVDAPAYAYALSTTNNAPTGALTITGMATQGEVLSVANTLADLDGMGTIHYQWQADGADIAGATSSTITLTQEQVGKAVRVTGGYTDTLGTIETVTSVATAPVANVNDAPVVVHALSDQIINAEVSFTFVVPANAFADPDAADVLKYTATLVNGLPLPAWLSFDGATRTFHGTLRWFHLFGQISH